MHLLDLIGRAVAGAGWPAGESHAHGDSNGVAEEAFGVDVLGVETVNPSELAAVN